MTDPTGALDAAWRLLGRRLAEAGPDAGVRIVPAEDGRVKLSVERLDAVGEPASLVELRAAVADRLPRVDLPELILEVHPGPGSSTSTPTSASWARGWRT